MVPFHLSSGAVRRMSLLACGAVPSGEATPGLA